jgi:cytochrome c oxidase subunit IV
MTMSTDTAIHDSQASVPGTSNEHAGGTHEGASDFTYIKIALALMALTGAEIAVSYLDIGRFQTPILLAMMFVKFFTVVLYFMHLKYDNRMFKRLFYTGLFLSMFVYTAALLTFHFFE